VTMNHSHRGASSTHKPDDSAPPPTNGTAGAKRPGFLQDAVSRATTLASRLDARVKQQPYAMLGIACIAGAGIGIVLSSRILRSVLTATASAAAVEAARSFIRARSQSAP
jgi:hypothetical protein